MFRKKKDKPSHSWPDFGRNRYSPEKIAYAERLLDEANALGALADQRIAALFSALAASPGDCHVLSLVEQVLNPYRFRNTIAPDPLRPYPGPESGLSMGDVEIGTVHETGLPWRLPLAGLPFITVVGATGQGKTSLVYNIIEGIGGRLAVLLISPKDDAARLLFDPPLLKCAYRLDELRLSLFTAPPGVNTETWQRNMVELFCQEWELQYSRTLLHEGCDMLRSLYSRYASKIGHNITFSPSGLTTWLKRSKSKYADGPISTLDILSRTTGDTFECSQGQPMEALFFRNSSVLSTSNLADVRVSRFVFDFILESAHQYFLANGPNDGSPRIFIIGEDAQPLLSEKNEHNAIMPLTQKLLIVRQSGVRIGAVAHIAADLAPAVFSQSGVIIQVGGLVHEKDVKAVGSAMGMPPADWPYLQAVKKAEFVARENLGRYDRPFGGVVRYFPPATRPFSEAQRKAAITPFLHALPWQPAVPLEQVERALAGIGIGAVPARTPQGLSPKALALAWDVYTNPWDFLFSRNRRLAVSGRAAQNVKDELLYSGWVREHAIARRGNSPILLEALAPLWNGLQVQRPNWGAKGGFVHAFCQHTIAGRLKKTGFTHVAIEKFFGSKSVDVAAVASTGELVGFEVAISLSNLVNNLSKDFWAQPNFAHITTICLSQQEVSQAKQMIVRAPVLQPFRSRLGVEAIARWL